MDGEACVRVPLNQCRKIFVQRDFSRGMPVRFQDSFPRELTDYISQDQWNYAINQLNNIYETAEKVGGRSMGETIIGCASCYLSKLCLRTQYDKQLDRATEFIDTQNGAVFVPRGLYLTDPRDRGLRVLEVSFLGEPAPLKPTQVQGDVLR